MGSANGRHRRPRQAPAIVVAAGVTGSALAIPLLAATSAGAADATTWDKVAECESGGTWSADFGNGYYGGLQFSQETWAAYGGTDYAQRADLASRAQQIEVAEKVLDAKGPQAWPGCAVISGLAPAGSLIGVDPGDTSAADAGASAGTIPDADGAPASTGTASSSSKGAKGGSGSSGATGSTGSSATPSPSASTTPSPSASSSASGKTTPGNTATPGKSGATTGATGAASDEATTGGKHRGTPDLGEAAADASRESGRHASRGDADARDEAAVTTDGTYTVRSGDNLWAIADAQNLADGWTGLYEANEDVIGTNPDLILPGQELNLGAETVAGATETVPGATAEGVPAN